MARKLVLFIFVVSFLLLFIDTTHALEIDTCQALSTPNILYEVNTSLNSTGVCLNITASNIIVDGKGYTIISDATPTMTDYGIFAKNVQNISIKGFSNISFYHTGIYFSNVSSSFIFNNTLSATNPIITYGIRVTSSNNNKIYNNTINWSAYGTSKYPYGILFSGVSQNTTIANNTIIVASDDVSKGINADADVSSSIFSGNKIDSRSQQATGISVDISPGTNYNVSITDNDFFVRSFKTTGNFVAYGFIGTFTENITILRNRINTTVNPAVKGADIFLNGNANNSWIQDCYLFGNNYSIYMGSTGGTNVTAINVSYDNSRELIDGGGTELTRLWYFSAYVNDSSGNPINGANISFFNATGDLTKSSLTNSSGWMNTTTLIDYYNDNGTIYNYSNYTIIVNLSGKINDSLEYNLSLHRNKWDNFFTLNQIPVHVNILSPGNMTYSNQSIIFNVTGENGLDTCLFSLNNWTSNTTMNKTNATAFFYYNHSMNNGTFTALFWCNDTHGSVNSTESVQFKIEIGTNVTDCRELNLPNTFYYIQNNIIEALPFTAALADVICVA